MRRPPRYTHLTRWYDAWSAEPVYRTGRRTGIDALGLRPGDRVLDVGCGTGLNFTRLRAAVGRSGSVIGVDLSAAMLARAAERVERQGWSNVHLVQSDAVGLDVRRVLAAVHSRGGERPFDAVLFTYALSIMDDPEAARGRATGLARDGARVAVVDMRLTTGRASWAAPLARLACALGGSDPLAHPWRLVERDCRDVAAYGLVWGHVQVRAGRLGGG